MYRVSKTLALIQIMIVVCIPILHFTTTRHDIKKRIHRVSIVAVPDFKAPKALRNKQIHIHHSTGSSMITTVSSILR